METDRICPSCGSDIWRAANYDEVSAARDRHWAIAKEQAIRILTLQARVAELEEWRRTKGRKVERQRRTIVRLEKRLRELGTLPHADKPLGEGDPVSPSPPLTTAPSSLDKEPKFPSPRGLRKLRRARQE